MAKISSKQLDHIKTKSIRVLDELITRNGTYASNNALWSGRYHHFFGRDSAITALLILEAEKLSGNYILSEQALGGCLAIAKYQGSKDDLKSGEETGKIPHEIVLSPEHVSKEFSKNLSKPWYIDPKDGFVKNWDSADSTALWIYIISKYVDNGWLWHEKHTQQYILATKWCLNNLHKFRGYNGWLPCDLQPGRQYGGLDNQTWKDSGDAFQYEKGGIVKYPLHDIYSNAVTWAALKSAEKILLTTDKKISKNAKKNAKRLKYRFNKQKNGFWIKNKAYYAEALDGNLKQLTAISIDPGMSLAFGSQNKTIFYKRRIDKIVNLIVSEEMYQRNIGVRTYSSKITNYNTADQYHRGPNTIWPFTNGLVALGLSSVGSQEAAKKVSNSLLDALSRFDYFVELYQLKDNNLCLWRSSNSKQTSAHNQAWTAAAAYYAACYLQNI